MPQLSAIWDDENWIPSQQTTNSVSISEDDKHVYIEAALPGITPEDIDITFEKGNVWIKGEIKEEQEDKKRKFYRQAASSFSYRIAVPGDIDSTKEPIATFKNGMVKITFVKAATAQPKKIQIKTE